MAALTGTGGVDRRPKRPPCPSCLACGEETRRHQWCSDGPPPPHGDACPCDMCEGERAYAIIAISTELSAVMGSTDPKEWGVTLRRFLPPLEEQIRRYASAATLYAAHWASNKAKIEAALARTPAEQHP